MTLAGIKTVVGLLWGGLFLLAALAGAGWWVARWQHRSTSVSARLLYVGAGLSVVVTFALMVTGAALRAPALAALGFPFVAFFFPAATWGHRYYRRSLGAGGDLRAHEMARSHSVAAWKTAVRSALVPDPDVARTHIANQGELVKDLPIRFRTLPINDSPNAPVVAAQPGRHIFVVGTTGMGKTRTIERVIAYRVRDDNSALVFVDPKPDKALEPFLRALAVRTGRPFYLIDPSSPESDRYNPLADKAPGTAAEVAVAGVELDVPFYKDALLLHLDKVCKAIHAKFGTVNLRLLAEAAALGAEKTVLGWAASDPAVAHELRSYYEEVGQHKDRINAIAGSVLRVQTVAQRRWATVFNPDERGEALSMIRALRERAIVLIRPVAGEGQDEARAVAGMVMADLNAACTVLDGEKEQWVAVLDEFGAVCKGENMQQLINLYQRARSAGGQLIAATQSVADLRALAENTDQADSLAENFGSIIVHKQMTTASREWLSMYMGTTELWAMTDRISGHGTSPAGEGSARRAREFRVGPDRFAALIEGEAIVYTAPARPAQGMVAMLPPPPSGGTPKDGVAYVAAGPASMPTGRVATNPVQPPPKAVQSILSGTEPDRAPEPSPETEPDDPGSLAPVVYADDEDDDGGGFANDIA